MADLATLGFLKNLRNNYLADNFGSLQNKIDDLERKMNKKFEELSEKIDQQTKK